MKTVPVPVFVRPPAPLMLATLESDPLAKVSVSMGLLAEPIA